MSNEGKIQTLQRLLSRVQANAQAPHPVRIAAVAPVAVPRDATSAHSPAAVAPAAVMARSEPEPAPVAEPISAVQPAAPIAAAAPPTAEIGDEAPAIDVSIEENVELLDEEIIEITDAESVPPAAAAAPPVDATAIDFEDEEEPPASSRRAKVASSMDEALADAAAEAGTEHEVPVKTPPPESGPQEAAPPAEALAPPRVPEVRPIEEAGSEFEIAARRPSAEQIGQTVELGAPTRADLELDRISSAPSAERGRDELEVALPKREPVAPAKPAEPTPKPAPVEPTPKPALVEPTPKPAPVAPPPAPAPVVPPPAAPIVAQVSERPEISGAQPVRVAGTAREFKPQSFLESLDASLGLGG